MEKILTAEENQIAFFYGGEYVGCNKALTVLERWVKRDMWEIDDVMPVWRRLIDQGEVYEERVDCAEIVTRITHDELEIIVDEP